ncbi:MULTISPECIES: MFS transporter [Burkholderiaceae]|uniref:Nitrate/nitrite transporter n=1 Tax=Caballeronia sordidicola TaxID=196367 RepID=A0A242N6A9_CABSO|nr:MULTISPECIES: MFS transporter [Burkholderiaceae]AME26379.1 MFS transporter permease [Burkholderia sp. PAMC 26561]OTP78706.1 Nitrate/nitrite transporter [Caballeronia sordidicola]
MSGSIPLAGSAAEASALEENAYRKAVWRIVPLLIVCFIFAYFDRVNISFAKLQMQGDLGLSNAAYGFGASIFFVGYFIFEIPSNLILSRVGARVWIARIMISWGIASAAMMFVTSETWFYVLRFVIGATEAGFLPGIILYFTYWFPAKRRARINALFMTSISISGVIGGPLSGFIMTRFAGVGGLAGWQWLFVLEGLPTALLGLLVLAILDDRISNAKWLSAEEKAVMQANIDREDKGTSHRFIDAMRQPGTLLLSLTYLFMLMGLYGLTFWMPQLIKNTGITSPMTIGLLTAIPYAVAGIGMVALGKSSDRHGERRWHLGLAVAVGGIGYALSAYFAHDTTLAMISLVIASVGAIGCLPVFWTLPPAFLSGTAAAGGIALINSIGNLGGIISPYLVGKVVDLTGATSGGLYAIATVLILAALLILFGLPARIANRDQAL